MLITAVLLWMVVSHDASAGASQDPAVWFGRADAAEHAGHAEDAIAALEHLLEMGSDRRQTVLLRIARLQAGLGQKSRALDTLDALLAARYPDRTALQSDAAFTAYHDDPHFRAIAGMLPPQPLERNEGWRFDLRYLVAEARRKHTGFDHETFARPAFSAAFERDAAALDKAIPALTDMQIVLGMQKLVALLGDGHSGVTAKMPHLPIEVYLFANGAFIVDADEPHRDLIGSELLAIGNDDVSTLIRRLTPWVKHDNVNSLMWNLPGFMTSLPHLQAIGDAGTSATVTLRDPRGATRRVELAGGVPSLPPEELRAATGAEAPLFLTHSSAHFFSARMPELHAAYLKVNLLLPEPAETLDQLAASVRDLPSDVHTFILDLRQDRGGNSYFIPAMIRALVGFEDAQKGRRIFVVIGRSTFSTGQNLATAVERYTHATFIGEPTGSSPNFTGEDAPFRLPWSHTYVNISVANHQGSCWWDERSSIAPAIPVSFTSSDYFVGRDPVVLAITREIDGGGGAAAK